jgi:hypothetical protein
MAALQKEPMPKPIAGEPGLGPVQGDYGSSWLRLPLIPGRWAKALGPAHFLPLPPMGGLTPTVRLDLPAPPETDLLWQRRKAAIPEDNW